MATTVVLQNQTDPDDGNATLSVDMEDMYNESKTVSLKVRPDVTTGQMVTLVDALEAFSNARVCHINLLTRYNVHGNKAAAGNLDFKSVFDLANFVFLSQTSCKDKLRLSVPAPLNTQFTGVQQILGNPSAQETIDLVTILSVLLQDKEGLRNYIYDSHYRSNTQMPIPNVT